MSKVILKKDITIKAGTIFECIDGRKSDYVEGNYSTLLGLSDDSCGEVIYNIDNDDKKLKEYFEEVE